MEGVGERRWCGIARLEGRFERFREELDNLKEVEAIGLLTSRSEYLSLLLYSPLPGLLSLAEREYSFAPSTCLAGSATIVESNIILRPR